MNARQTPAGVRADGRQVSFSVVIPCYNADQYLADTIEAALGQRYAPLEVLVIDDGSTDGTLSIAEAYAARDKRVRLLHTPAPSGGPSAPRNIGFAASRADYVALLDADDWWSADKLANDACFLESHTPDILYSGAYSFSGTRENIRGTLPSRKLTRRFEIKNHVVASSIVVRKGYSAGKCHIFDPDPVMKLEDYHFLLDAYFGGAQISNRPGIDTYYRLHVSGSRLRYDDLRELLRRQYYNLSKLAALHELGLTHYYLLMLGVTLRIGRQALWKRLRRSSA